MERGDLLKINGGIFGPYGAAINEHAASDVRVLVVGNPCNTNCLIAQSHAPDIPADRWYTMTRLDENRARTQLAKKAGVHHAEVTNVAIWGNHSATQYPDFANARISGRPVPDVITDRAWLEGEFIETIQKRGAAVIAKRGQSSATSAAHAIVDSVNSIHTPTPGDDWHSLAVVSAGEYGVPEGLVFGYPGAQRRPVDLGRRRHRARRLRPSEDRRHHRGARRRTRRGPRAARELMPERYALTFEQPDGVNGAVRLVVFDDHASYWVALDLGEAGFVAIRHDHVSRPRAGALLEVRADGLWAELVCEVPTSTGRSGSKRSACGSTTATRRAPRRSASVCPWASTWNGTKAR